MSNFHELKPDNLRNHWDDEQKDFTPWLSDNIHYLENALGLNLEVIDVERNIGRYSLDLLVKDTNSNRDVVVENQLENSDHKHLGQSLAYASGVDADVVVWIASDFYDEHKDTIQWLNENSEKGVDLFAIRLEVWRIDDSEPAVRLNPVVQPSEWKDRVKETEEELTETEELRLNFWSGLRDEIKSRDTDLSVRKPTKYTWYGQPMGRQDVKMEFWVHVNDEWIDTKLVIEDRELFETLKKEKEEINTQLSGDPEWQPPTEDRKRGHIMVEKDVDIWKEHNWPEYYNWFIETGEKYREVFYDRIN